MAALADLISRIFHRGPPPFHDFGYRNAAAAKTIRAGLRRVTGMYTLHQHQAYVAEFEKEFASRFQINHAIGLASGTDALFMAMRLAGVGPGREVITVANTWVTTLTTVHELGGSCRYVDIDPATGLMDPKAIENAINPATAAIVPVHMYGSMAPMREIVGIAARHGICVIEDACQAVGASLDGHAAGTWGDAGCFSFHTTKLVGAPADGGMVVTSRADWAEALRVGAIVEWARSPEAYQPRIPSRLAAIAVPFLNAQLHALPCVIKRRKAQVARYMEHLAGVPGVRFLQPPSGVAPSYRNCIIVSPDKTKLLHALKAAGLPVEEIYPQSRHLVERLHVQGILLPHTLSLARDHLSLPLGLQITNAMIDRIANLIARARRASTVPCTESIAA